MENEMPMEAQWSWLCHSSVKLRKDHESHLYYAFDEEMRLLRDVWHTDTHPPLDLDEYANIGIVKTISITLLALLSWFRGIWVIFLWIEYFKLKETVSRF